jgi:hypothetical protein
MHTHTHTHTHTITHTQTHTNVYTIFIQAVECDGDEADEFDEIYDDIPVT